MKQKHSLIIAILLLCLAATSCKDDNNDPTPSDVLHNTNNWVLSRMKYFYYWNNYIPTSPNIDLPTEDFFYSLLKRPDDRFSWIQNAADLQNELNGVSKSNGIDFKLYRIKSNNNSLVGQVLYVFPNSPAARAGILRGDLFAKVNGEQLTLDNYANLLFGASSSNMELGFVTITGSSFAQGKSAHIIAEVVIENPIMLDTIYTINGTKIGYFAYKNFFQDPGDNSLSYDNKMEEIFGKFKQAGINELVLDLRLNTGGAITSSVKLASQIVKGATFNDILLTTQYNTILTSEIIKSNGPDYFKTKFKDLPNNVGSTITRLVVLTSNRTASASELIINGLRPYMPVILVGDTTMGKNMGSISITDETGKITWGLQPLIVKLFNKNNESNYSKGFVPDILDLDTSMVIYPFGDLRETLLRKTISQIYGLSLPTITTLKSTSVATQGEVYNSLDRRRNTFSTWMDK